MPWPYNTAGYQTDYQLNVPVESPSQSNMPCLVLKVAFPNQHNEIRDLPATLLTEVCKDVLCIEPELQPLR